MTIPAILIDVDTTLADVNPWLPLILPDHPRNPKPGQKDFAAFHEGCRDADLVHETVKDITTYESDYFVDTHTFPARIITTAREAIWRDLTDEWLKMWGFRYDFMLMRPIGDRRHDYLVKRDMVIFLRNQGYFLAHAWDDSPLVLEMFEATGIPTTEIPRREAAV